MSFFRICITIVLIAFGLSRSAAYACAQNNDYQGAPVAEGVIEPILEDEPTRDSMTLDQDSDLDSPIASTDRLLRQIDLSVAPQQNTPTMQPAPQHGSKNLGQVVKSISWESANVQHRSLLFDEPMLERHGISSNECTQPVVSGMKFFARGFFLPVIIGTHRNCESSGLRGIPQIR